MRWLRTILTILTVFATLQAPGSLAADFVVYSVFRPLDLGNPGETPKKDFYVNMGSAQGLRVGAELDVVRRVSTYDLLNEKLYQDVSVPIARMKVIHVENSAAICRVDQVVNPEKSPALSIPGVMVGDLVRPAGN